MKNLESRFIRDNTVCDHCGKEVNNYFLLDAPAAEEKLCFDCYFDKTNAESVYDLFSLVIE